VAITIDTVAFPPHVLLVRGAASLEEVDGVPAEYLQATAKQVGPEQMPAFEAQVRGLYKKMVRIRVVPSWAKLLDLRRGCPARSRSCCDSSKRRLRVDTGQPVGRKV
jgi:hypothetical protein